jgi:integrase
MATIEKREFKDGKVSYRVKVRLKGYPPETASFESKRDAERWAKKIEADMQAGRHFGETKRHTFADLATEFESKAIRKARLDYWQEAFGTDRLDTITPARIAKERDKLAAGTTTRKDANGQPLKRTGATVNRYLAALSACMAYGVKELQWLERNPMERVQKPAESKGRVRFLSDDERPRLLDACRSNPDLYLSVVLSLTTGARQEEIMALRWPQIDLNRQIITLHDTKNGDRRALPLVGEALDLLKARSKVRSISDDRIFPPSQGARKAEYLNLRRPWEQALVAAKIQDFHWHDLRHTAASYMAMSGVSLVEIAKVLGHRTLAMVARYSHLSDGHILATGNKLAAALDLSGKRG